MDHPLEALGTFFAGLGTFGLGLAAVIAALKPKQTKKRRRR
ncbi:hypothetical protein [Microbacterium sp. MEJ108Y]|nr:hypothetical protein [Microbacterium sp. MEJ108Y]